MQVHHGKSNSTQIISAEWAAGESAGGANVLLDP
jgi:hypothetical protein